MIIAIVGSVIFFLISILYVLIALGLPLGEFVMGGKYRSMPNNMRYVIGFSALVQWFAIIVLLQTAGLIPLLFSARATRGICFFFAVFLSLNVVMNLFSQSKKEKYTMTPLSIIVAVSFWLTAFAA